MAVVVLWLPSPVTFTYTVVVPALVLVGFVVVHVLLSVEYSIVPPVPPLTPIVWLAPSYTPLYAVNVGFVADTFATVILPLVVFAFLFPSLSLITDAFKLILKLPAAKPFNVIVYVYPFVTAVGLLIASIRPTVVLDIVKLLVAKVWLFIPLSLSVHVRLIVPVVP